MKTFIGIFCVLAWVMLASAQAPDTLWTRTFGGSYYDWAESVQQTADGGYIVAGYTYSFGAGGEDFFLVKTNAQGDALWTHTYGGLRNDRAASVQQTADGGYIVAGFTDSFGAGGTDFYLVKTNPQGDTLWTRAYGGGRTDVANSVQQTADGGYIVAGYTASYGAGLGDFYVVKTTAQGDTLWTRTYGGSGGEEAFSIQQTTDGGYIIAGLTSSFGAGGADFFLVRTNAQGDTLWTHTYGGSDLDMATSVRQTTDGGFIIAGTTWSYNASGEDFFLVKTNAHGDTLWTRTYGGSNWDDAFSAQQTADGGFIVAGRTLNVGEGAGSDFFLVKTNAQGDTMWTCSYGGDGAHSVQQTADGGYIVAGGIWFSGTYYMYLVKTAPDPMNVERKPASLPNLFTLHPNFPNPFNPTTQIAYELPQTERVTMKVFNLMGENIATLVDGMQTAGSHTTVFDGSGLASGVYFYSMQTAGFVQTRKMMLLK
ncbi:MAG: T9SS type A sorting domain-containing protein [Calditrichota bacterium]